MVSDLTKPTQIHRQRQQTWIRYKPDRLTDGPHRAQRQAEAAALARSSVRALDHVQAINSPSEPKQFNASRKRRHDQAWGQYGAGKRQLDQELQFRTQQLALKVQEELEKSEIGIQAQFDKIADHVMIDMELKEFEGIWKAVEKEYSSRNAAWEKVDQELAEIECERGRQITLLLETALATLTDIAFQLPADIERDLDKEANAVNAIIISNRSTFSEFIARLRVADVRLKDRQQQLWEGKRGACKLLQHKRAIVVAKGKLAEEDYTDPLWRRRSLEELTQEQTRIMQSIGHLMMVLRGLVPPHISISKVHQVQTGSGEILQRSVDVCNHCLGALSSGLETMKAAQSVLLDQLRTDLLQYGAFGQIEIEQEIESEVVVIIKTQEAAALHLMDQISAVPVQEEKLLHGRLASVIRFYLGVAEIWEKAMGSLDDLEIETTEAWMWRRDVYDDELKVLEAEIHGVMQESRQAPNETTLEASFQAAKGIIGLSGRMETCHRAWHRDSAAIADGQAAALDKTLNEITMQFYAALQLAEPAVSVQEVANKIVGQGGEGGEVIPSGEGSIHQYKLDMALLCEMVHEFRQAFLSEFQSISERERGRVQSLRTDRLHELDTELDKALRVLMSRLVRLEVDVVQVRAIELKANLDRFHRSWARYDRVYSRGETLFKSSCEAAETNLVNRCQEMDQFKSQIGSASSLQALQVFHYQAMAMGRAFAARNKIRIDALVSQHKALQVQLKAISQQFLSSCIAFQSGSGQPGCYHPEEIGKYAAELQIFVSAADKTHAEQWRIIEELRQKMKGIENRKDVQEALRMAQKQIQVEKSRK